MVLFAYVVFAILQTSFTLPAGPSATPFEDLESVLPLKEIQDLKTKHLQSDPSFQAAVKYFKSPEWMAMVADLRDTPEWVTYKNFIKEAGLDLDAFIKHLDHCVNGTDVTAFKVDGVKPSLRKFLEDVKTTYGIQILKGLQEFIQKNGKKEATQKLKEQMTSPKSKELLEKVMAKPALQKIVKKLKQMGIDVDYVLHVVYTFAGWEMTTPKA